MLVTGYSTTIAMARRGFDLSGDLSNSPSGIREQLVFQLGGPTLLVAAAVRQRHKPAIHKRLMVLATVGGLMTAALAHIIGHSPALRQILPLPSMTTGPWAECIPCRYGGIGLLVWAIVRATLIGPSTAWREFADWLIR